MSINCLNCGAPNDNTRRKCAYCGSTLSQATAAAVPPAPQYQGAPQPQGQPPYIGQPQQGPYAQPMYVQQVMMPGQMMGPPKNLIAAALLAFFLGALGIHNFYLGHTGKGVAQLLLTILGSAVFFIGPIIAGIWAFVEFILILVRAYPDRWGRPLV